MMVLIKKVVQPVAFLSKIQKTKGRVIGKKKNDIKDKTAVFLIVLYSFRKIVDELIVKTTIQNTNANVSRNCPCLASNPRLSLG